jgi:hypothetical protein
VTAEERQILRDLAEMVGELSCLMEAKPGAVFMAKRILDRSFCIQVLLEEVVNGELKEES